MKKNLITATKIILMAIIIGTGITVSITGCGRNQIYGEQREDEE